MGQFSCIFSLRQAAALLLFSAGVTCARAETGDTPLFSDHSTLAVRIEAPLTTLMRERSDTEYLDGSFFYTGADGREIRLDLKLRARGRYRRESDTCSMPPLRLNFRKKQVEGTLFAGQDKLKLVAHCNNNITRFDQYVLKEYLAYRVYNLLSDHSFRVRLLRVEYVDTQRNGPFLTRYGFLIEDDEALGGRIGAARAEIPYIHSSQLDPAHAARVAAFEYLIGNTDFSMLAGARGETCCHNAVLFSSEPDRYIPVPYDFDFSGLVNAPYAEPNPKLRIRRVTTRLYRGHCIYNAELDAALTQIIEQRESIGGILASLPGLEDRTRQSAERFVTGFFEVAANPRHVERRMLRGCSD